MGHSAPARQTAQSSRRSGAPPSPGICGAAGRAGAGREGRLPCCAHRSSCCPWSSTFWGATPSLTTTQCLQTLQVGGSPSLFPQNTAPLQKQPGVCGCRSDPPEGPRPPPGTRSPSGQLLTGAAGQLPLTRSWTAPCLMGHLVVRVLSGSQQVPETRSGSEAQQNSPAGRCCCPRSCRASLAPRPPPSVHLLSLDVALDLGDLDLHGIQLLVQHQGDAGCGLRLVHRLKAEVREWDVPLAVVLLGFAGWGGNINRLPTFLRLSHCLPVWEP